MNDYLLSVVLGIIEGLTEYLPVSSTAHLRIPEALFHLSLSDGYWKMYTIVIQLATFSACLCTFVTGSRNCSPRFPGASVGIVPS